MAPDDSLSQIIGALAAAPAPISAEGVCLLCEARVSGTYGLGMHAPRCAWQRAQLRKAQLVQRLVADLERPAETPISMALRLVASSVTNAHRQLDDAHFFAILLSLYELAGETKCRVHLARQVQRTMRADSALEHRLRDWLATADETGGPHAI